MLLTWQMTLVVLTVSAAATFLVFKLVGWPRKKRKSIQLGERLQQGLQQAEAKREDKKS